MAMFVIDCSQSGGGLSDGKTGDYPRGIPRMGGLRCMDRAKEMMLLFFTIHSAFGDE